MKLLMFYVNDWWYRTASKGLPEAPDAEGEGAFPEGAAVLFVHAEERDAGETKGVVEKLVKNAKWIAGKFGTRSVVLHSFNHLSSSKAPADVALAILDDAEMRLARAGYSVMRTPFGYFNEFKMHVAGDSLAKVFKEF